MILEPMAGPTQADKLLPETNITTINVKTTRIIEKSMSTSLKDGSYNGNNQV